jgi:malto-oligosyltrehalose trehalohydrolase
MRPEPNSRRTERVAHAAASRGRAHDMPFGAMPGHGGVTFRLWAPKVEGISILLDGSPDPVRLTPLGDGWHREFISGAGPGSLYSYVLPDGRRVPDPASRFQPHDVHGPSEVIDPRAFVWECERWVGRPWNEAIIYELHVGTFTSEGTFLAAIRKLDHLAALGITAIELMPVADFPGKRNWGYDGVALFAPESTYGRPEHLKAFIDAAHLRGLMVMLDVVYNHFGPEGNYLPLYAPIFTERHHTPWGAAVNYDAQGSSTVRELVIENALYWLEEFQFDGLRLDAVHSIIDESPKDLLEELAVRCRGAHPERHIHLILENEDNDPDRLIRSAHGRPLRYTAQWNDDLHHCLHVISTGETAGYYGDYRQPVAQLGRTLAEGFAFQGEQMAYSGRRRGRPSAHLPPTAFVAFLQNHDQVGNRAFGDRLHHSAPPAAFRAAASIYLLSPQIPMLFMGEEWMASAPFPFFCDFGPDLAKAVTNGRREEFSRFPEFKDPERRRQIPDPSACETFNSAKLDWNELTRSPHAEARRWYSEIVAVRQGEICPLLPLISAGAGTYEAFAPAGLLVRWTLVNGSELQLVANLSPASVNLDIESGRVIWREGEAQPRELGPWSTLWQVVKSTDPGLLQDLSSGSTRRAKASMNSR